MAINSFTIAAKPGHELILEHAVRSDVLTIRVTGDGAIKLDSIDVIELRKWLMQNQPRKPAF